jgi:hypothetical protein
MAGGSTRRLIKEGEADSRVPERTCLHCDVTMAEATHETTSDAAKLRVDADRPVESDKSDRPVFESATGPPSIRVRSVSLRTCPRNHRQNERYYGRSDGWDASSRGRSGTATPVGFARRCERFCPSS